jgi:ferredoxin-like protein FixX
LGIYPDYSSDENAGYAFNGTSKWLLTKHKLTFFCVDACADYDAHVTEATYTVCFKIVCTKINILIASSCNIYWNFPVFTFGI